MAFRPGWNILENARVIMAVFKTLKEIHAQGPFDFSCLGAALVMPLQPGSNVLGGTGVIAAIL